MWFLATGPPGKSWGEGFESEQSSAFSVHQEICKFLPVSEKCISLYINTAHIHWEKIWKIQEIIEQASPPKWSRKMATHSSILAWRIPWTEEPGGYSPWGHKELDMTETTEQAPPKSSLLWDWLAFVLTLMDPSDGGILLPALHMAVSWQSGGGRALSGLLSHSWGLHPHDLSTSQNLHPLQCCLTGGEHFNMNLGGGVVIDT